MSAAVRNGDRAAIAAFELETRVQPAIDALLAAKRGDDIAELVVRAACALDYVRHTLEAMTDPVMVAGLAFLRRAHQERGGAS